MKFFSLINSSWQRGIHMFQIDVHAFVFYKQYEYLHSRLFEIRNTALSAWHKTYSRNLHMLMEPSFFYCSTWIPRMPSFWVVFMLGHTCLRKLLRFSILIEEISDGNNWNSPVVLNSTKNAHIWQIASEIPWNKQVAIYIKYVTYLSFFFSVASV